MTPTEVIMDLDPGALEALVARLKSMTGTLGRDYHTGQEFVLSPSQNVVDTLRECLAYLSASGSGSAGWRDMSSAPKDGTDFLWRDHIPLSSDLVPRIPLPFPPRVPAMNKPIRDDEPDNDNGEDLTVCEFCRRPIFGRVYMDEGLTPACEECASPSNPGEPSHE